jgi:hypothetical protein
MVGLLAVCLRRIEAGTAALAKVDADAAHELSPYWIQDADKLGKLRDDLRRWVGQARALLTDLGMTPASAAALGADLARAEDALVDLQEAGRAIRERRAAS